MFACICSLAINHTYTVQTELMFAAIKFFRYNTDPKVFRASYSLVNHALCLFFQIKLQANFVHTHLFKFCQYDKRVTKVHYTVRLVKHILTHPGVQ